MLTLNQDVLQAVKSCVSRFSHPSNGTRLAAFWTRSPARPRKLEKEEEEKELQDLEAVCASPEKEGIEFAAVRLETIQDHLKEQFNEIFAELKQTLEVFLSIVVRLRRAFPCTSLPVFHS